MKRKPKLIFKINRNNTADLYVGGKWQKDVTSLSIKALPFSHDIEFEQIKHDSNGDIMVANNEVVCDKKRIHFGGE